MQDNEMASNIKTFDAPYFPLSPVPTKRKLMVMFAAVMGLMIVLAYIFLIEFLDNTLKNPSRASGIIKLPVIGVVPKIQAKQKKINLPLVTNRLMDIAVQYIELHLNEAKKAYTTKTLLFFSTQNAEGKTVFVINLARKLEEQGKKVLVLSYDHESLKRSKLANSEEYGQYEESANAEAGDKIGSVDHANSFLSLPGEEHRNFKVVRYTVNSSFYTVKNYQDILKINEIAISDIPDFVLIELPSIMYNPYPVSLLSNSDLSILICRSNRAWSLADKGALDRFTKFTDNRAYLVLNGVDIPAIDSVLGDSPSKIG
jgi:hypothetical protein